MDAVSTPTGNGCLTTGSSCPKTEEKQKSANLRRPQKPQMGKKLTRNITIAQMVRKILTPFTRAVSLSARRPHTRRRQTPAREEILGACETDGGFVPRTRTVRLQINTKTRRLRSGNNGPAVRADVGEDAQPRQARTATRGEAAPHRQIGGNGADRQRPAGVRVRGGPRAARLGGRLSGRGPEREPQVAPGRTLRDSLAKVWGR